MKMLKGRAPWSPVILGLTVFLLGISNSRAVDPVDFLESLKDDTELSSGTEGTSTEYPNGVNVIPGEAEVNYPVYSTIPKSSFSCIGRPVGFYADTELRCQVWHICDEDRRQQSFLCTNGTVYSQEKRVCDWWYNVNCDPTEVKQNYLQNYDLYKGPPPKSENAEENNQNQEKNSNNKNNDYNNSNKNINEFDYQPTTKSSSRDQFYSQSRQPSDSQRQPQRYNNNNEQYSKPTTTPSYNEPSTREDSSYSNNNFQQSQSRRHPQTHPARQTTTTTYRPPTTYSTPAPPAALQGSSFPPQRHQSHHHQQQQKQQSPATTTPQPRAQPSQKTYSANGKRIVEIRVPISQIPPEILAKYGKRIPELILKEIFLNFTRGQQQQLQQEAIKDIKPSNPTGAGNNRSPPPKAPVSEARYSQPPSPPPSRSQSKKPVDFGSDRASNDYKPSFSSPPPKNNGHSPAPPKSNSPPPPPPPQEPQQKFRHSTPRKVDNVKFATPTRELLADYDDERQLVGESQNPAYSLQQLFSSHHSRKSKSFQNDNEVPRVKESFTFEPTTTTTTAQLFQEQQQPNYRQQEFTRSQPRRRTQTPVTSTYRSTTTTTEEPALITDRYVPVATKEEKKNAEVRRILLVAKQGIKVLPPIPFLSSGSAQQEPLHPTPRRVPPTTQRPHGRRTTPFQEFSKIGVPPAPKVAIPDDYYVKNERFQEAESRYPTPKVPAAYIEPFQQAYQRPSTTTTVTTTTSTTTQAPPPPTPFFQEPDFRRTKPSKPQQNKKKALPPPPAAKKSDSSSDYDDGDDGSPREQFNTDELELLRLAQEYIDLTGQDFGIRQQPKNA